ncbi:Glucose 1-dehydrogenase 4 [Geobacillus sp. BCO2]|nr:Glucose 1-dehydrogenase 4 [Geobacillus sp. BCO2]
MFLIVGDRSCIKPTVFSWIPPESKRSKGREKRLHMSMEQKTAIVTGGANGIGKAIARAYAKQGANVVIIDRDIQNGEAFAAQLQSDGFQAIFVAADVRKVDDIERFVQEAAGRFGRIDYLINNAGVSRWKSPYELTAKEWDDVLSTNLRSAFLLLEKQRNICAAMQKAEPSSTLPRQGRSCPSRIPRRTLHRKAALSL